MESAIPDHLFQAQTQPARAGIYPGADGQGVVPRFDATVSHVSIAYFGVQFYQECSPDEGKRAHDWLLSALAAADGAGHFELARFVDVNGCVNITFICYWINGNFWSWWNRIGSKWTRDAAWLRGIGRFAEVFSPSIDRVEAITDGLTLHGLTALAGRTSEPVIEQGYWGAMRDRLPVSQSDPLLPSGSFKKVTDGSLVSVQAPSNLCIIRTGQDWSRGEDDERLRYRERIEPSMSASMNILDQTGVKFGCLCNRYAWLIDGKGAMKEATFGMSIWLSVAHLEQWSWGHFSHLTNYARSLEHSKQYGEKAKLSRYHELAVPTAQQAFFEYRNCHVKTGVLGFEVQ